MDTKKDAIALSEEILRELLKFGTQIDEFYRKFREFRLLEDDPSFRSALINTEHAFFMLVQSINILKEQLILLKVASQKEEVY